MSERIRIEALKPGMVIVQVTRQNGPVKIRKSGLVSSDAMVQGLAEMGVQEVEIDPEQTVEVDAPVQHRTQTQALLRGQHDTSARLDHSLSDQFNRSLFLPTVQSLPSVWKIYGKQVLTFLVIILGGAGIGFTAATHSLWWPAFETNTSQPSTVASNKQEVSPVSAKSTTGTDNNASADTASTDSGERMANEPAQQAQNSQPEPKPDTPTAPTEQQQQSSNAQAPTQQQLETEGRVLNQPDERNVDVSPELMARFNKAVEALDDEAGRDSEPQTKLTVHDDIPRVDQLPVRLLTRLPSMNFSAHMYASQADDRWVRVNGKQLVEGDWIDEQVQIVNIEAQHVVLGFEQEIFKMAALTDW